MKTPILEAIKITKVANATAAGQTTINSSSVDMKGYESCVFMTTPGTITAGAATSIKVQGSTDNSSFSDLAGTSQTIADDDDNQVFAAEVVKPQHRYLRATILRATQDAVIGEIYAIQGGATSQAVENAVTDTFTEEINYSPAAGTA